MGPGTLSQPPAQRNGLTLVGVVVALEIEARGLVGKSAIQVGSPYLSEGVMVTISGNGAENGRRAAVNLLAKGATALVTWGSAGALHPSLLPGNLVLPENIILPDKTRYGVDIGWHRRLFDCLNDHLRLHTGSLLQSPTILTNPSEKEGLYRKYCTVAVDMESAAVACVAQQEKIPFVAIRSIVDTTSMSMPHSVLGATDKHGRLRLGRLLKSLARNPQELPHIFRLGRNFCVALNTLISVRRITGKKLMAP